MMLAFKTLFFLYVLLISQVVADHLVKLTAIYGDGDKDDLTRRVGYVSDDEADKIMDDIQSESDNDYIAHKSLIRRIITIQNIQLCDKDDTTKVTNDMKAMVETIIGRSLSSTS